MGVNHKSSTSMPSYYIVPSVWSVGQLFSHKSDNHPSSTPVMFKVSGVILEEHRSHKINNSTKLKEIACPIHSLMLRCQKLKKVHGGLQNGMLVYGLRQKPSRRSRQWDAFWCYIKTCQVLKVRHFFLKKWQDIEVSWNGDTPKPFILIRLRHFQKNQRLLNQGWEIWTLCGYDIPLFH